MPTAHLTELEAVNQMLLSIGQAPVTSLPSSLVDASIAQTTLNNVSREIQAQGWHCNTNQDVVYTPDAEDGDKIVVATNILKIDTVQPGVRRSGSSLAPSRIYNASLRENSASEGTFLLYNVDDNSTSWADVSSLTCDEVFFEEFGNLTPLLQTYILTAAAHRFQKGLVGSTILHQYTEEDVLEAKIAAEAEEAENEDTNLLHHNAGVQAGAWRRNKLWGS